MRLFFNSWPFLLDPLLDSLFISFGRPSLRFLRAPAQLMKQPSDMIHMVSYCEPFLDQLGHSGTSPKICGKPYRFCSLEQFLFQLLLFWGRKFRGTAWNRLSLKGQRALFQEGCFPTSYTATIHTKLSGYFNRLVLFFSFPSS